MLFFPFVFFQRKKKNDHKKKKDFDEDNLESNLEVFSFSLSFFLEFGNLSLPFLFLIDVSSF